ncbi:quinone-dependent dihydroorotate dehydrogenase [Chamaesiphon polymorphus]|uniref:Dihydroorotate dehydrogenase (quinone) n=1 Tax=Chamaesiphon polymorphus CCALA 037 TaxID=2107692 RepID=A0A2T1GCS8_9CYAN|nr:quinone-dependent dihydroorotate dehydrogenase [Chamaesiphon polymorphus]PSB55233.1 dihydroorotate dehydrogenase (quinone) [Chamaesiphon polymorphus CCALA 037]
MDIYQLAVRPLLFSALKADPEVVHKQSLNLLHAIDSTPTSPLTKIAKASFQQYFCRVDRQLEQSLFGLKFANPVGLAAGFDKDGIAAGIWQYLGFGFAELGTVTYHPQPGNERPRLFRLPQDRAALNRMGFNNLGSAAMAAALQQRPQGDFTIPIGINLGKSKITELKDAATDYLGSFQRLKDLGDYFVINVSSPNTPGLRTLQEIEPLRIIFDTLQQENQGRKPILVKIAPDLAWEDISAVVELSQASKLAGIIATNTTLDRSQLTTKIIARTGKTVIEEAGGISGAPVRQKSTEVIRFIHQQTGGSLPIIGVGGIFTADDAWDKIIAGASLIQVYTGWTYNGPWMVDRILRGLLAKLESRGLGSIAEAVGIGED